MISYKHRIVKYLAHSQPIFGDHKMETRKRAVACLIGGIFGMLVALAVKPIFSWLWVTTGMTAGAILAYFCYDLRQVFEKASLAWKKTFGYISDWCLKTDQEVRNWKTGAFFKFCFATSIFPTIVLSYLFICSRPPEDIGDISAVNTENFIYSFAISCFLWLMAGIVPALLFLLLAWLGITFVEKKFWFPFFITEGPITTEEKIAALEKKGFAKTTPTVARLFRWSIEGIAFIIIAIFYFGIPFFLRIVVSLIRFVCILIRLIHSEGRIASALYSALAILISCLFWGRNDETTTESAFDVFSAGVIVGGFGFLSCKISQRLGLAPNK